MEMFFSRFVPAGRKRPGHPVAFVFQKSRETAVRQERLKTVRHLLQDKN
jgi:hypothetical protein